MNITNIKKDTLSGCVLYLAANVTSLLHSLVGSIILVNIIN